MNPFHVTLNSDRKVTSLTSGPFLSEPLLLTLTLSVPIRIADLASIGGPQDYHEEALIERYRVVTGIELEDGGKWRGSGFADLMFGGKFAKDEMALLCDLIAFLAFQPGGVRVFDLHFESHVESEATE